MKAWVLREIGDFSLQEVEKPTPEAGEVLVRIHAAGICGSDIPRIYRTGTYHYPLIPGHEFAGEVLETGCGVDKSLLGKRVGVFPLIPCKKCDPCQKKYFEMCRDYSYIGSRQAGAFAEYVRVPEWNLIELPQNVSYEAAAMLEPMAVAVHAMRRVNPQPEDKVVICGVGTIGMLLLMMLLEAGIKQVLVIGNKAFQRAQVLKLGLAEDFYLDARSQNINELVMEKTGSGADVFFECVGRNETVVQAIDLTAPAGRVMLVGNPYGDMQLDKGVYWKILRNQLSVTGTWNSSFAHDDDDDWHYVLERLAKERIRPETLISQKYSLAEMLPGFELMRDKTEDYIKVMGIV